MYFISSTAAMTKRLIALLCLRVVALYHGVRWMKWLLWIGFVFCHEIRLGLTTAGGYYFAGEYIRYYEEWDHWN